MLFRSSKKYVPEIMDGLRNFWHPDNPLGSIEYLLQNSKIFNRIQDLLLETHATTESIKDDMKMIAQKSMDAVSETNKETKSAIKELMCRFETRLYNERASMDLFKCEMNKKIKEIQ